MKYELLSAGLALTLPLLAAIWLNREDDLFMMIASTTFVILCTVASAICIIAAFTA